jgi:hypothetical protein
VILGAALAERYALIPESISAIRCTLNATDYAYPGVLNRGPFTDMGSTLMSTPFCLASAFLHRDATLATLRELDDPVISALIQRTTIEADLDLPPLAARVEVETVAGDTFFDELLPNEHTFASSWESALESAERLRPEMGGRARELGRLEALVKRFDELSRVEEVLVSTGRGVQRSR